MLALPEDSRIRMPVLVVRSGSVNGLLRVEVPDHLAPLALPKRQGIGWLLGGGSGQGCVGARLRGEADGVLMPPRNRVGPDAVSGVTTWRRGL